MAANYALRPDFLRKLPADSIIVIEADPVVTVIGLATG
jgi:hypothetical protein